ncbi:MAG: hypothetical protein IT342_01510 [Candidatus Melainabacteria bacterium]|nr:hypothetical protein [Candidatus Melainabacteria bacterium]
MPPIESHSGASELAPSKADADNSGSLLFETAYSLGRETKMIGLGVGEAVVDTIKHPLDKLPELGMAFGTGSALGAISKAGAPGRLIAGGIGLAMAVKLGYDEITGNRWSKFGHAVADTWRSGENMDKNIALTRDSLGSFVVDMGVGYAGMKAGGMAVSRFAPNFQAAKFVEPPKGVELAKGLEPAKTGELAKVTEAGKVSEVQVSEVSKTGEVARVAAPARFTFEALQAQLAKAGLAEEAIAAAAKSETYLGRGGNATVYEIPGVKDFVLRVPGPPGKGVQNAGKLESVPDIFPEGNVGQAVAKVGNSTILKVQEGVPAGGPLGRDARAMGETAARKIYGDSIERTADMPQSAYDQFAQRLLNLDKKGLQFDPSKANNVLVDKPGGNFNLVDITPRNPNSTYRHSLSDMVVTLMDNGFINSIADRGKPWQAQYQTIISKAVSAAERTGLPLDLNGSSLRYSFQLANATTFWADLATKTGQTQLPPLAPKVRAQ